MNIYPELFGKNTCFQLAIICNWPCGANGSNKLIESLTLVIACNRPYVTQVKTMKIVDLMIHVALSRYGMMHVLMYRALSSAV